MLGASASRPFLRVVTPGRDFTWVTRIAHGFKHAGRTILAFWISASSRLPHATQKKSPRTKIRPRVFTFSYMPLLVRDTHHRVSRPCKSSPEMKVEDCVCTQTTPPSEVLVCSKEAHHVSQWLTCWSLAKCLTHNRIAVHSGDSSTSISRRLACQIHSSDFRYIVGARYVNRLNLRIKNDEPNAR